VHWSLPKAVAQFSGDVAAGATTATGDGWTVSVRSRTRGPRLPVAGPLTTAQDGHRALASLRGRGRLAQVEVAATGLVLGGWLGAGRHPGVVAEGRMVVHPPA
jgi:hypothetical protein